MTTATTTTVTIGKDGLVTLPPDVQAAAHLVEGDVIQIEVTEDGILLRLPVENWPDPWYYDTREWEAGDQRAAEDVAAGRLTYHDSDEAFLASLEERAKRADS